MLNSPARFLFDQKNQLSLPFVSLLVEGGIGAEGAEGAEYTGAEVVTSLPVSIIPRPRPPPL